jgi:hypothetical protein
MSCFTLKSTRIKSLPFLMSKKWEAVQKARGGAFFIYFSEQSPFGFHF